MMLTTQTGGANLMGADLYKNLTNYFIQHLTEVRAVRVPPREDHVVQAADSG